MWRVRKRSKSNFLLPLPTIIYRMYTPNPLVCREVEWSTTTKRMTKISGDIDRSEGKATSSVWNSFECAEFDNNVTRWS